ncbi:MAG: CYTH domain-containing protein [Notoacmeibacter sp.]|nr:CYTH domain-containing protein [Notoacmeibacter sp.]
MAKEIERKFLVAGDSWREASDSGTMILQAYVAMQNGNSVRVRIMGDGSAMLAVKTGGSAMVRDEFEYPVPVGDARRMMECCVGDVIDKVRHLLVHKGFIWEIDVYRGALEGIIVAEVEMETIDDNPPLPDWIGREITGEPAYSNVSLALHGKPEMVS